MSMTFIEIQQDGYAYTSLCCNSAVFIKHHSSADALTYACAQCHELYDAEMHGLSEVEA